MVGTGYPHHLTGTPKVPPLSRFRAGTGASCFLDFRNRICYGARGQDGFRDATREEERRRASTVGRWCLLKDPATAENVLGVGAPPLRPRPPAVPHRSCHPRATSDGQPGIERTTTVTSIRPLSWSSSPDQQERIPRMCLISLGAALPRRPFA